MKTILFPTDFQKGTIEAFALACRMANKTNGRIVLLHVIDMPPDSIYNPAAIQVSDLEKAVKKANAGFARLKDIVAENKNCRITLEFEVVRGRVLTEIVRASKRIQPDAVLIGNGHKSDVGRLARSVPNKVKMPVLAVNRFQSVRVLRPQSDFWGRWNHLWAGSGEGLKKQILHF